MADVEDFLIDFRKEDKSGAGVRFRVKPGQYKVKVLAAKAGTSAQKGTPQLTLTLQILEGKHKGKKFNENLYATPKAFSRFRVLMEACDLEVPQRVNLTQIAKDVKGSVLYVELDDEIDKDGKYPPRSRVTFEGFINEADYEADGDEDDDEEDDADEEDEEDAEDEDDEDEDDEPEPPKKKSKAKPAPAAKAKKKKPADDDDDDDLDLEDL